VKINSEIELGLAKSIPLLHQAMKTKIYFWVFCAAFLVSCQKSTQTYLSKEQMEQRVDSLTEIRFKELEKEAAIDLDRRIPIEVKPKVDSIVNERMQ